MNSCTIMAKIIRSPELRYTQENQTPIATMLVEFEGSRPDDPPATLRVVSWGNMASEVQEKYSEGDRVIIVGRLSMNTIERQEGFKEKRAELTVSQIYPLDGSDSLAATSSSPRTNSQDDYAESAPQTPVASQISGAEKPKTAAATASSESEPNLDDIPF